MNITASTAKQTILNSMLKESAFAKIQSAINLNEEGFIAESFSPNGAGAAPFPQMEFSFSPFRFDGTEAEKQSGQVLFTGKGFGGRSLLAIMQGSDAAEKASAVFAYSACAAQAIKEGVPLPANGAGGVLYKQEKGKASLLFLPQGIFGFSAANCEKKDAALLQDVWQDKNLRESRALAFVRAVLVYQALSGGFPFPAESLEERQADILDARYLPIKNKVNGINEKLAEQISYALEYGSAAFEEKLRESEFRKDFRVKPENDGASKSGKGGGGPFAGIEWLDKEFALAELAAELGLAADGTVSGVERKTAVRQEDFEKEAQKLLKKKTAKTAASRALRRNRALFVAGIFLIAGSLFFGRSVRRDKMTRPTTVSLSPRETAEVFFSGLHSMDTILMHAASKGKEAGALTDSVANLHVASKMRDAFSQTKGTVSPELYVYRADLSDKWIYGITNFMLGESGSSLTQADNRKSAPIPKQKPLPLKEKNGAQRVLQIRFFRVHNEGPESDISVEETSGSASLTFKKNRWLVTGIDIGGQEKTYPLKEFLADREAALETAQGDALEAAKILRKKYEWIPSDREMAAARIECETRTGQE